MRIACNPTLAAGFNSCIDSAALGAIFLAAIGDFERAQRCLAHIEQTYQPVSASTIKGYAPYADRTTVWTRGTLQVALAYRHIGETEKCRTIIEELVTVMNSDGSLPFATPTAATITKEAYREWPSVAGTSWLALVLADNDLIFGP